MAREPNRSEAATTEPLWLGPVKEFNHFFALCPWLAAILAFIAGCQYPGQGMMELGFAMGGVIGIHGLFSYWPAYRPTGDHRYPQSGM